MAGAPPRIDSVKLDPGDHAYGPLEGTAELREKVAAEYNRRYRQGKASQYTAANVSIASGGRLALTRAFAALGRVAVGYQNPDYTAYEDMFDLHLGRVTPVAVTGLAENAFAITPDQLASATAEHNLRAFIFSNPCNPTGHVIAGDELAQIVAQSRADDLTLLSDEFYSHFIYKSDAAADGGDLVPGDAPISAAAYVDDVERDPVLIFDGLTKSHRYPGWRVGWVIGPSAMVENMARTASSLDGGPSRVAQAAALEALDSARTDQETTALRKVFCHKRNLMVRRLESLGVRFLRAPDSTFYCWGSLEGLQAPFDDAMEFFNAALERQVLTVPGAFFDIRPGGANPSPLERHKSSPFRQWMRFSFGPPLDNMTLGLDRLEEMLGG
jgi:aspartate/methionine/tyrosine aminotransferase